MCQLQPDRAVLVGVSGGPDSLCLMSLLHRSGYPLIIAHLDHGLRPEAGADAAMVQRYAGSLGLPCLLDQVDVRGYAGDHSLSLEEAARELRYRFLFEQAETFHAQAVAVGHTADDQVETVLMHLLRGTGLQGLRGMTYRSLPTAWSQEIPLVRPLLEFWRREIIAYIRENELIPALDASNLDTTYFRNRLRHELLPYLEQFNPQIRQSLWRTAQVLEAEDAFIESALDAAWDDVCAEMGQGSGKFDGKGYAALTRSALLAQPLAIQRRLLRRAVGRLRPGLRDVDFQTIERGLASFSAGQGGSQCDLVAGLRLRVEGDQVWIYDRLADLPSQDWPQLGTSRQVSLEVPGSVQLQDGWVLCADFEEDSAIAHAQAGENSDQYQAWIDYDRLQPPLSLRRRKAGDRFKPLGLDGRSIKISDFMINLKIPVRARDHWPLVMSGEEILWVPGCRLAHPFRLTPDTRRAVHLHLDRRENRD
jgi:tRNA(Ile)-lysidine synthase